MIWASAIISVIIFSLLLSKSGVINAAKKANLSIKSTIQTLKDPYLSDIEKEKIIQLSSISLFKKFLHISIASLISLLAPYSLLLLGEKFGYASAEDVIRFTFSIEFIISATIVILVIFFRATRK